MGVLYSDFLAYATLGEATNDESTGTPVRIRFLTPSIGNIAGDTTVEIYLEGQGESATAVTFDGNAGTVVSKTDTLLTVKTPAGTAGNVDVVVSVGAQSDTLTSGFLYTALTLDSPIGNYLDALEAKFQESTFATTAANVVVGESIDLMGLARDTANFPRLEILITKDKASGYGSQRNIDFDFRYSVAGYIRRESDDVSTQDMKNIMNFGTEIRALNYQFLDEKQQGNPPCVGFSRLGEYPETFYEFELFPKITAFIFEMNALLYLSDTQVS